MADIITKDDMYRAIRGYKYQHCPVLSGLNKTELGELVNKYDLNVEPTGARRRATGTGRGVRWEVPDRRKTTWRSKEDRTNPAVGARFTGLIGKRGGVMMIKPKADLQKSKRKQKAAAEAALPQRKKLKKAKLKM